MAVSAAHFRNLDSSLDSLKKCSKYVLTGMEFASEVALDVQEMTANEDQVQEVEDVMVEYAAMERDLNQFVEAVETVKHQLKSGELSDHVAVEKALSEHLEVGQQGNSKEQLLQHEMITMLHEKLRELKGEEETAPSPQPGGSQAGGDDDDDDIQMTQTEDNLKCPFTQQEFKEPVKNKKCGHVYEKGPIIQHIRRKKGVKCPVGACANTDPLSEQDLEDDLETRRKIQKKNRQAGRKEARNRDMPF
ncbi:E3 SUMO-protein ligase NSE2-like [Branchiostoma lanceolatum]|uniref:E3 SUMO-protein ligase NSE2-like n=1 Tax=Branchiostoma lanceolatum TaxID=7740 RepID=UPI0034525A30